MPKLYLPCVVSLLILLSAGPIVSALPEENPKFFPAEENGIPNQYNVLLDIETIPSEAAAEALAQQFGGRIDLVWNDALRGFRINATENQARGISNSPLVKGVYQDVATPADDVLSNDIPYCYSSTPRGNDCDPPGHWEFNTRSFSGLPQTITCSDPDPAASGCIDNWGLDRIDGYSQYRDGQFTAASLGSSVHVYVLDTGIKASNLEFGGRVSNGHNGTYDEPGCSGCFPLCYSPCGTDTNDYHGHGTFVAGILGGEFFGVGKDVTLHPVRIYNNSCAYVESALIDGLNWIAGSHHSSLGTGVVNLSSNGINWGTEPAFEPIREAVRGVASRDDLLFVQSAGNFDDDACDHGFGDESIYTIGSPEFEAAARVIIAGGSDEDDGRWFCDPGTDENCTVLNSGSNYGTCVDLFAPAAHIVSAFHGAGGPDDNKAVCRLSGTSMAAPHVAGAATLILESNPFMTSTDLKSQLLGQSLSDVLDSSSIGMGSPNLLLHINPATVFADGFESGDTSAWAGVVQ